MPNNVKGHAWCYVGMMTEIAVYECHSDSRNNYKAERKQQETI